MGTPMPEPRKDVKIVGRIIREGDLCRDRIQLDVYVGTKNYHICEYAHDYAFTSYGEELLDHVLKALRTKLVNHMKVINV